MELGFIKWFIGAIVVVLILASVEAAYTTYTVNQCKLAYVTTDRKAEEIRRICNR
jgi:ethanolamine utilization microcompartment shell protein EutS